MTSEASSEKSPSPLSPWWKSRGLLALGVAIPLVVTGLLLGTYFLAQPQKFGTIFPTPTDVSFTPVPHVTQSPVTPSALISSTPALSTFNVYFSTHPGSDNDPTIIKAVSRTGSDLGVARAALLQLLAGPTPTEAKNALYSAWHLSGASNCSGNDATISIAYTEATVRLCKDTSSPGIMEDARAQAEADATLKQFPTIKKVIYLNKSGGCLFDQSGLNRCLSKE